MPRAWIRKLGNNHTPLIAGFLAGSLVVSAVISLTFAKALPVPTMTREYEEMTNEYMKFMNMNPIFGD